MTLECCRIIYFLSFSLISSYFVYFLCSQMNDKLLETENEAMSKIVELEKQLMQKNKELDATRVSFTFTLHL